MELDPKYHCSAAKTKYFFSIFFLNQHSFSRFEGLHWLTPLPPSLRFVDTVYMLVIGNGP